MQIIRVGKDLIFDLNREDLTQTSQTLTIVENVIKEDGALRVVANLESITSIYSVQIGTLVAMHVLAYENIAVMKLANVNEHVKNQLRLVGLDKIMEIHHGVHTALESFGPPK
ncbi:MAG: hypothetical protein WCT04_16555 [Planctomycetota bacterium]